MFFKLRSVNRSTRRERERERRSVIVSLRFSGVEPFDKEYLRCGRSTFGAESRSIFHWFVGCGEKLGARTSCTNFERNDEQWTWVVLVSSSTVLSLNDWACCLVNPYENLNRRVSDCLDKGVNNEVSRSLLKDEPLETKTDLILAKVCEGIVSLLRRWPDQKYKLHAFINQPLPQPIRFAGWHLYLTNGNRTCFVHISSRTRQHYLVDRQRFVDDLSKNPRGLLSPMDAHIQHNSDGFVSKLPVASQMIESKGSFPFDALRKATLTTIEWSLPGNISAMKAILSYYHSLFSNKRDLADSEYYYAIPIVLSHHPALSK